MYTPTCGVMAMPWAAAPCADNTVSVTPSTSTAAKRFMITQPPDVYLTLPLLLHYPTVQTDSRVPPNTDRVHEPSARSSGRPGVAGRLPRRRSTGTCHARIARTTAAT